jgi:hypothetical protein
MLWRSEVGLLIFLHTVRRRLADSKNDRKKYQSTEKFKTMDKVKMTFFVLGEVDKFFEHEIKSRDDDRGYCGVKDGPHHENFSQVIHNGKIDCHI